MGVMLICEAPDCFRTTSAILVQNKVAAPEGWWMMAGLNRIVVACCQDHLNAINKAKASKSGRT